MSARAKPAVPADGGGAPVRRDSFVKHETTAPAVMTTTGGDS